MNRRILVICCVLFAVLTLSGCIGMIVNSPEECTNQTPFTGYHDIFWKPPPPKKEAIGLVFERSPKASSKSEFLKDWGNPDEIISTSEKLETWIYHRKLWCGIIPVLILPVPLILPVCDGFDRIEFKENKAIRLHARSIVWKGGILFVLYPIGGPPLIGGEVGESACRFPLYSNNGVL